MSVSYNIDIDTEQSSEIEGNMSIHIVWYLFIHSKQLFIWNGYSEVTIRKRMETMKTMEIYNFYSIGQLFQVYMFLHVNNIMYAHKAARRDYFRHDSISKT